ncbi:hypothetical protein Patl1_18159 [Pistacia atlantica]|uniref:Uncharacterized protein n=1 Tax=Pistacia atlantica TaxID=434234 RepID=A0ACC1C1G0_9ROSI|nr:hypothetical protein Patl1_18159 [Pistacia atlantica]
MIFSHTIFILIQINTQHHHPYLNQKENTNKIIQLAKIDSVVRFNPNHTDQIDVSDLCLPFLSHAQPTSLLLLPIFARSNHHPLF